MRIADALLRVLVIGAAFAAGPAFALDGSKSENAMAAAPAVAAPLAPMPRAVMPPGAIHSGTNALKPAGIPGGLHALEYAAEQGHPLAQWKLGRMYMEGEGVTRNARKAFEYFSRIADEHAEDSPYSPQARFVANAFLALGQYYLTGIPKMVERDPERAREMFNFAASYFGDPDTQYQLARLYLEGVGAPHDPRLAVRWFKLSAQKGQCAGQAMLGAMLFAGDNIPRQAALGLMWLTIAKDNAAKDKAYANDLVWINKLYDSAIAQASPDEQAMAGLFLKRQLKDWRE